MSCQVAGWDVAPCRHFGSSPAPLFNPPTHDQGERGAVTAPLLITDGEAAACKGDRLDAGRPVKVPGGCLDAGRPEKVPGDRGRPGDGVQTW